LWLMASPWSPPAWMKFNNSMLGGTILSKYFPAYANYFGKFLDSYAAEGVKVNSVTTQNEVDTHQEGRMPACLWGQEYELKFVRDHLGPMMAKSANPADIWILDHNYNLWGRVLDSLEDAELRKFVKGVAWHGYVGTPDQMMNVKKVHPDMDMFWTEGGDDYDWPDYLTDWAKWGATFTDILRNQCRCIIAWNYALDEHGKPNVGPFNCGGLITVDSQTRALTYSGQYKAFDQFSRHIPRGSRVLQSSGDAGDVKHVVTRSASGYTAILTNRGKQEARVSLRISRSAVAATLPADSVTTLTWS
jgi:glucosylceramidase